jgi:osmotically-inducible protein OsmY
MANRYQDYSNQSGSRRYSQEWRDDEDNSYDDGRVQYGRSRERDTDEQSGSTGRYAGYGDFGRGDYGGERSGWSGQDRYGQTGYGQGNYGGSQRGRYGEGQGSRGSSDYGYSGGESRRRYGQGSGDYGYGQNYGGQRAYGEEWRSPQRGYGGEGRFGGESSRQDYFTGESSGMSGGMGGMGGVGYAGQGYGQGMGEHRGKGPKGYQRSDERTKELLCERLREDPHIDPSEVTITVQGGKITLEGTVDSRQTKNAIEEVAEQFGTQDVQNNLRIQRAQQGMQSSTEMGKQGKGSSDDNTATKQKQH